MAKLTLRNAGFLADMKIGETMSWTTKNNVSVKRLSFAFFLCRCDGFAKVLEGCNAYKWITEGVSLQ